MRRCGLDWRWFILALTWSLPAAAAEVIPPSPPRYFNDYAGVVQPAAVADELNNKLEDFEKQTSNQVWVVVYPKMQSDSSIEDYCTRVFQSWKVGQRDKKNGVVLFVFVDDHKMRIQTGYGLEGALPDAMCKRIEEDEIKPRFKANDYAGGLRAGVEAVIAATKGEYKGTASSSKGPPALGVIIFLILIGGFLVFVAVLSRKAGRLAGTSYGSSGRRSSSGWSWNMGGGSWGSSGGGGGFGGGGFSGGGGSTGGGGASSSW
jgi:uncharacterized protein